MPIVRPHVVAESERIIAEVQAAHDTGAPPVLSQDDYSLMIDGWNQLVRRTQAYRHRELNVTRRTKDCALHGHLWADAGSHLVCVRCPEHRMRKEPTAGR